MANVSVKNVSIRLLFDAGLNGEGKAVTKRKTYSRIRLNATPEQMYNTSAALAVLTSYQLIEIESVESGRVTL
ncbi:DUF1659 domain-containing protein [Jeotgalibacillus terrae]|uniref:DUF1659 domain-containing protein n=1 Tax=Jeotgalibacillus terrae TaxID=587735 RepID=A0ABW5ZFQ9_9BACL|nr:DUF1659 domain-containing protein [Jeotgalibacillus terrae]MBM7579291.1 hypothetical protein [Jeotgalibacillus terrae]